MLYGIISIIFWIIMIVAAVHVFRKYNVQLYRSTENKVLAGVCGGLGEILKVDPVLIRILWVIFTLCGGSGILIYIIATIIIPKRTYSEL